VSPYSRRFRAPVAAAEFAENLRRQAERDNEVRRAKHAVLDSLLANRAKNSSAESVRALNTVAFAFYESRDVRSALSGFLDVANGAANHDARVKCYLALIVSILQDLGYSQAITTADVDRGYFPN